MALLTANSMITDIRPKSLGNQLKGFGSWKQRPCKSCGIPWEGRSWSLSTTAMWLSEAFSLAHLPFFPSGIRGWVSEAQMQWYQCFLHFLRWGSELSLPQLFLHSLTMVEWTNLVISMLSGSLPQLWISDGYRPSGSDTLIIWCSLGDLKRRLHRG